MDFVKKIVVWLQGKKSFGIAIGVGVTAALQYAGIIYEPTADILYKLLGAGGVVTFAAKLNRAANS